MVGRGGPLVAGRSQPAIPAVGGAGGPCIRFGARRRPAGRSRRGNGSALRRPRWDSSARSATGARDPGRRIHGRCRWPSSAGPRRSAGRHARRPGVRGSPPGSRHGRVCAVEWRGLVGGIARLLPPGGGRDPAWRAHGAQLVDGSGGLGAAPGGDRPGRGRAAGPPPRAPDPAHRRPGDGVSARGHTASHGFRCVVIPTGPGGRDREPRQRGEQRLARDREPRPRRGHVPPGSGSSPGGGKPASDVSGRVTGAAASTWPGAPHGTADRAMSRADRERPRAGTGDATARPPAMTESPLRRLAARVVRVLQG